VSATSRPEARGKFIYAGNEKIVAKGPTYGAFAPNEKKEEYWFRDKIERDFALMAEHGFNAVRIPHTMPPVSLLDAAERHGLRVMVGLSAEQYAGFLADPHKKAPDMRRLMREKVKPVAGHPALLCYALGNEIPASMVRWIGKRKVERYLERLYEAVKEVDPEGIVTYVNYPSTEYLQLPFLDALSFNVYLEAQDRLEAYLARLHSLAGDRPLLMSELGLDTMRNGEEKQAEVLTWQLQTVLRSGCAGAFIFSWTDEWHRAGQQVDDWAFGLTHIDRTPKPALKAVAEVLREGVFPRETPWPKVSVVVCSYNGSKTIRQTLEALQRLDYPDYEVIVVDDGSTDATPQIAAEYPVRLVSQKNIGLSGARNTGAGLAKGEIIAYVDDDAYPDQDWLRFLAWTYLTTDFAAVGGPNVTPPDDPPMARAVGHAPGHAIHVLITDTEAEHIPGCNMSFRRSALQGIGGFDSRFRTAGDDVDACWRVQTSGMKIGFSPAAMVWHHRRSSIRAYWNQQKGYGRAEALLEQKWSHRYNALGHVSWRGSVYGAAVLRPVGRFRGRIYQGTWGTAPFQSLYKHGPGLIQTLPLMPEWYLAILPLLGLGFVGAFIWKPLLAAGVLGIFMLAASIIDAIQRGYRTRF
jgi:GT2 family glycosyltransferase